MLRLIELDLVLVFLGVLFITEGIISILYYRHSLNVLQEVRVIRILCGAYLLIRGLTKIKNIPLALTIAVMCLLSLILGYFLGKTLF